MRTLNVALSIFIFLYSQLALSQNLSFGIDHELISSEETANEEVKRIQSLTISKSLELNHDSLRDARSGIEFYGSFSDIFKRYENIPIDKVEAEISDAVKELDIHIKNCDLNSISRQIKVITRAFQKLPFMYFGLTQPGWTWMNSSSSSEIESQSDRSIVDDVHTFLTLSNNDLCKQYAEEDERTKILKKVTSIIQIYSNMLDKKISELKKQEPRAKRIAQAWEKRHDDLLKSIEKQSAPVNQVAGQLGWIIGVFCIFGVLMFVSVTVFKESVQIELIASGQVIQFATVMVLLIVICVLGMSKLLNENVLGTLLGGIGGYVLSQGVGRAATRAATRESPPKDK